MTLRLPISLVAFDLDGTTVERGTTSMSPVMREAFAAAHDQGVVVSVATGRPVGELDFLLGEEWLDYLITVNGSVVRRHVDMGLAFSSPLPAGKAREVIDALAPLQPKWQAFFEDESCIEEGTYSYMMERSGHSIDEMRKILPHVEIVDSIPSLLEDCNYRGACKLQCTLADEMARQEAYERLLPLGGLELARMGQREVEITTAGATKGSALARLVGLLGLDPSHCVAFGDDTNDLTMAGRVGAFVVVENGSEAALAVADEACPSVQEDGVATWLTAHLG